MTWLIDAGCWPVPAGPFSAFSPGEAETARWCRHLQADEVLLWVGRPMGLFSYKRYGLPSLHYAISSLRAMTLYGGLIYPFVSMPLRPDTDVWRPEDLPHTIILKKRATRRHWMHTLFPGCPILNFQFTELGEPHRVEELIRSVINRARGSA